jgi:hypothetical protein
MDLSAVFESRPIMDQIATVEFRDAYSGDEALAIVRAAPGIVGVALSLRSDGDIEVLLPPTAAKALLKALHEALAVATAMTAPDAHPGLEVMRPADDVYCWLEQESSVMLKAVTRSGDPVELTAVDSRTIAAALLAFAEQLD